MSPTFEGLPDELIDEIIGYIDQYAALVDLKRTCKRFDEFTEWALYRSVTLKDSNREQFERSLLNRPERCDRVRELSVEAESLSGCTQAPLYATLANLEVLSIKSVHSRHDERAEDVEEGDVVTLWDMDQVILQATISHASMLRPVGDRIWCHLRSFTFDFWNGHGEAVPLFVEPEIFTIATLEELMIRNVRFGPPDGGDLEDSPYKGQTALKKLVLDNCHIHDIPLRRFLAMPCALEHLVLRHVSDTEMEKFPFEAKRQSGRG